MHNIAPVTPRTLVGLLCMIVPMFNVSAQQISGLPIKAVQSTRITKLTSEGKNYEPMWSPDGTRIAFESTRDGNLEIYVMNADGTAQVRLTHNDDADASPSWSPDEATILFFSNRRSSANPTGQWKLYSMEADGANQRRLTNSSLAAFRPVMSPDGTHIAFDAWSEAMETHQVFVMDREGNAVERLTHTRAYESAPQWSPDGLRLVFFSERDYQPDEDARETPAEIYIMNANGSSQRRVTSLHARSHYPYWSPDGRHIAFETDVTGDLEIFVIGEDGTGLRNVTNHPGRDTSVSWSPDGKRLAFVSDRAGKADIYVLELSSLSIEERE